MFVCISIFFLCLSSGQKFCLINLDPFPAHFQEPKIKINEIEKTATCSTKGGFPEPDIMWSTEDGGTNLEPHEQPAVTFEEDGTLDVSSTINMTGLKKVICDVYNPTSNQTLSATKDLQVKGTYRIIFLFRI